MTDKIEPWQYMAAWQVLETLKEDAVGFGTPIMQALQHISLIQKHILSKLEIPEKETYYIRFGDIPENEESKIYCGEQEVGTEKGVSVYPAFKANGNWVIGLTLPITKTSLYTQQHLLEYDSKPCYLVTGNCVGKGSDGEPLIKNVKVVSEIKDYRRK